MEKNKQIENEFHAVEIMRQVRSKMNEQFPDDKQKYLDFLKKQWKILNSNERIHSYI